MPPETTPAVVTPPPVIPTPTPSVATPPEPAAPAADLPIVDDTDSEDARDIDLGIFKDVDADTGDVRTAPVVPPVTPAAPTAPVIPPVVVAPQAPAAPVTPATPPVAPVAPAAPAEPAAPATPSDPTAQYIAWRGNAEKLLAERHFKLSKEEVDAINADPAGELPKHMARVYLDAVTAATNVLVSSLPQAIRNTMNLDKDTSAAAERFYGEWPGLREHAPQILEIAKVYRQLNPRADEKQFIQDVGAHALVALKIDPAIARGKQPTLQSTGPRVPPHRPPGAASRAVGGPVAPANEFEELAQPDD